MNPYRDPSDPTGELRVGACEEIDPRLVSWWRRLFAKLVFLSGHYWMLQDGQFRVKTSHLW